MCRSCGRQVSVTAGTIFQDTRSSLPTWFRAIWWVAVQKNGASALSLQRILGLGSYRTAWIWLHKLRRAMVRPGRERLTGEVEIDETLVGGPEGGGRSHGTKKALVVVAAEIRGQAIGRIRLRRVPNATAAILLPFVQETVEPGALVVTDGWRGYLRLEEIGYRHRRRIGNGDTSLPRVNRVASLLKRWLLGTHQGAVRHRHLDYYLDEFTFRFNRRNSTHRGKLFHRLLENAVAIEPAPYKVIRGGRRSG